MKIQLDTTLKTIKVEESVKLSKLIETLKKLLPNNEWKDFTLETNTVISYWSNPIIIKEYPVYPQRPYWQPWYNQPQYTSSIGKMSAEYKSANNLNTMQLKSGKYNVEA